MSRAGERWYQDTDQNDLRFMVGLCAFVTCCPLFTLQSPMITT
jgi:hypothetical protein